MPTELDLAKVAEAWQREWIEKGFGKGLAKGFIDGFYEGFAHALVRLLLKKFGPLDRALLARIQSADPEVVQSWLGRVVDAPDLLSVFQPPGECAPG